MELTKGSVVVVKKFVDAGSTNRVGMAEMSVFWQSLTDNEKFQFTLEAINLMPELAQSKLLS
jgi:hypothetical protein